MQIGPERLEDALNAAGGRRAPAAGGLVSLEPSLGDWLVRQGWEFEARERDEHGYVHGVWWPPHLAKGRE